MKASILLILSFIICLNLKSQPCPTLEEAYLHLDTCKRLNFAEGIWNVHLFLAPTFSTYDEKKWEAFNHDRIFIRLVNDEYQVCHYGRAKKTKQLYLSRNLLTASWLPIGDAPKTDCRVYAYSGFLYLRQQVHISEIDMYKKDYSFKQFAKYIKKTQAGLSCLSLSFFKSYPYAKATGTGFALSNASRMIVTNAHVVDNAHNVYVYGLKGDFSQKELVQVHAIDYSNDIALLKVTNLEPNPFGDIPYGFELEKPQLLSPGYTLGYPLLESKQFIRPIFTKGIFSSIKSYPDGTTYHFDMKLFSGHSGSPLFNQNGDVISINKASGIDFIKKSHSTSCADLFALLDKYNIPRPQLSKSKLANLPLHEQIKAYENFIYLIEIGD